MTHLPQLRFAVRAALLAASGLVATSQGPPAAAPTSRPESPSERPSTERTEEGGYEVLFAVRGLPDEGGFGTAFGRAGDTNGDGVEDFFVTAPYPAAGRARRGSVRVFSGDDGRTLWRADGEAFLQRGPHQEGELGLLGTACADVNADGVPDLALASIHRANDDRRGLALHVLSGSDGERLASMTPGWPERDASLGVLGDVDGDGSPELWLCLPAYEVEGERVGAVAVVSPARGEVLDVHPGQGHGFGTSAWGSGDGSLWIAAPRAGLQRCVWRLDEVLTGPLGVSGQGTGRAGSWGTSMTGMGRACGAEGDPTRLVATFSAGGASMLGAFDADLQETCWTELDTTSPAELSSLESFARGPALGVVLGSPFSRTVRVQRTVEGGPLLQVHHLACGDRLPGGASVAEIDVDRDGASELLVAGAGHFHGHPLSTQGEVQLIRATASAGPVPEPGEFDARVLRERGVLHLLTPPRQVGTAAQSVGFGSGVVAAGDLDGDGVGDLAVGPWIAGENSAQLLAYSGRSGERLFAIVDDKLFGYAALGDRDGDGRGDLVVQSTDVPQRPGGRAWLASGSFGGPLQAEREAFAGWGQHVVVAGDVDGDGTPELLVGAPVDSDGDGTAGPASARLHAGTTGEELFRWDLADKRNELGAALAAAGDLDGDGVPDVLVGAPAARFDGNDRDRRGAVFAYSGSTGVLLFAAFGSTRGDRFGHALAVTPDADADGVPDVLVGAPRAGDGRRGAAYLLSGADGRRLFELAGERPDELFGQSVACAQDLDGDGAAELLVGAPVAAHVFPPRFGRVYAFALADGREVFRLNDPERRDDCIRGDFGWSLALPGDLDGDGRAELAVGAPYRRLDRDDGSVWVFSGSALGR